MTKLEAVNRMLEWIGQPPVTALDTGGTSEEAEAEAILDRESKAVQARGWWCNTDLNVAAAPGMGGKIAVDSDWITAEAAAGEWANLAIRGGNLYDVDNATDVFTRTLHLRTVTLLDFEDAPEQLAIYINKQAAYVYLRYKRPGDNDDSERRGEVAIARKDAVREDDKWRKTNLLNTPDQRDFLGRRDRYPWGNW